VGSGSSRKTTVQADPLATTAAATAASTAATLRRKACRCGRTVLSTPRYAYNLVWAGRNRAGSAGVTAQRTHCTFKTPHARLCVPYIRTSTYYSLKMLNHRGTDPLRSVARFVGCLYSVCIIALPSYGASDLQFMYVNKLESVSHRRCS